MHNEVHDSLRCKFLSWLASDKDAADKEDALRAEWMNQPLFFPDRSVYRSWKQVRRKAGLSRPAVRVAWRKAAAVAAVWVAAMVSGVLVWQYVSADTVVELRQYTVAVGHTGHLTLPDGTTVVANAGTTIVYPDRFEGDERIIYLSGEANFDVYHDSGHPFIVKTPMLAIQALGTRFNVQAYPEDRMTLTTLENGKVSVTSIADPERRFILKPDEQLCYDRLTHDFSMHTIDVAMASGWMNGELNFINCPIENILTVMQRHYGVDIKADPEIYTGDLYNIRLKRDESLHNAMRIVAMTVGGVEWRISSGGNMSLRSKARDEAMKGGDAE